MVKISSSLFIILSYSDLIHRIYIYILCFQNSKDFAGVGYSRDRSRGVEKSEKIKNSRSSCVERV